MKKITLIPGDGIGPEVVSAAQRCIEATGVKITWEVQEAGEKVYKKIGKPITPEVLESIRKNKLALKGPITTPIGKGFRSINVFLRQELDLYAGLRPCKTFKGVKSRYDDIDLVIVRENTEDLYAGIEFEQGDPRILKLDKRIRKDAAVSLKPISVFGSTRIAEFAFDYAKANKRKKVTVVHKANIMKFTDGLFLEIASKVAKKYNILFEDRIVDNMCMQLVQKPELYDVLLLPNLYGDIVSDLCAGLVGGLGVVPSANIGKKHAVFEAVHGSAPKYAGKNKVNPSAMILSGVMLLRYMNEQKKAQQLEQAVAKVIAEGKKVTYDLARGKAVGTKEMADAVIKAMQE